MNNLDLLYESYKGCNGATIPKDYNQYIYNTEELKSYLKYDNEIDDIMNLYLIVRDSEDAIVELEKNLYNTSYKDKLECIRYLKQIGTKANIKRLIFNRMQIVKGDLIRKIYESGYKCEQEIRKDLEIIINKKIQLKNN